MQKFWKNEQHKVTIMFLSIRDNHWSYFVYKQIHAIFWIVLFLERVVLSLERTFQPPKDKELIRFPNI